MKKLFTLFLIISCVLSLNAQITESGKGFKETFDYPDSTDYVDYGEGLFVEWPEGSTVQDGILTWALVDSSDGWFGVEFDDSLDLTDNAKLEFKYAFSLDSTVFVDIYLMDALGGEAELSGDTVGGGGTLREVTLDLSTAEGIDISQIKLVGIIFYTDFAGSFSFDDLLIGDAELEEVIITDPITDSGKGFKERFDYPDGTDYVEYVEGLFVEWPEESTVQDGILTWALGDSSDGWFGVEFDAPFDLSGNANMKFKYAFSLDSTVFVDLYLMDALGGEAELSGDTVGGGGTLREVTLDLSTAEGIDVSQLSLIGIIFYTDFAGSFSFDDLLIGDAIVETGISNHTLQNNFSIYPNPATSDFRIDVDAEMVSIFNISGQVVYSERNYRKGRSINVGQFESGLYIVKADENIQKLIIR